ncbi:hypothetical protein [Nitratireductor pacificus]|uniref:hypothetical protein n=1 Tax=Nitratireductor pacificus TaxID=1231180 RepID=UPI0002DC1107|nr:hypothetical protein [Nitratireductor pacificus]
MIAPATSDMRTPFAPLACCFGGLSRGATIRLAAAAVKRVLLLPPSPRGAARREKSPAKARLRGIATIPGWLPAR